MKGLKLYQKILIGLVLGVLVGLIFRESASSSSLLLALGNLFLTLIKMVIVPLVFASLVAGAAGVGDVRKLGRMGGKTVAYFLVTTAVAVLIGLILANIIRPGSGLTIDVGAATSSAQKAPSILDTILGIFPANPLDAMLKVQMLPIIVFALFVGISIALVGDRGKPVLEVAESFAQVMYRMTAIVMEVAPYGVFALIATTVGKYGASVLLPFVKVIIAVYLGCILHMALTYSVTVSTFGRISPVAFFRGILPAQLVAFSTSSSSATLPVTMRCVEENLGVKKGVSSFVLPLGATINMDGTALYQGVCALFVAQVYGLNLTLGQQLSIVLTATLASIGTAGVPGAGLIMLTMVLTSVGLPLEGVALIAGIDRILDMARTTVNITGDAAASVFVASTEGELAVVETKTKSVPA
ncbi:MAG: dicarboxylate/amino acid:cation symporter [Firmicutes bacterium]|nr:dicarboxylate/amino acid:cation symporter [Bacillota bacterium]